MAKEKHSSFEGTSGGAVPEGKVVITAAEFGYSDDYMNGTAMCAMFDYTLDGEEADRPLLFSTGSGWEPKKGGAIAVLEETGEPNPRGFNRSTEFFKWMLSCSNAGLNLEKEIGEAYEIGGWVGLAFETAAVEEKNNVSGEMRDKCRAVKFLGREGAAKPKKDKKKKEAAADDDA